MGTYSIKCSNCNKPFLWFSGNTGDQRCHECKGPQEIPKKKEKMESENEQLQTLKQLISVQQDLICYLKAELERLTAIQTSANDSLPPTNPLGTPGWPVAPPNVGQPLVPQYPPPSSPTSPWIVTCESGSSAVSPTDIKTPIEATQGEQVPLLDLHTIIMK